ncbi:MAG: double-strand break repair protein AddB, partial [Caulobacteraceae bacterium]
MSFLAAPAPRWFTIGAHRPFLVDLAKGIFAALGANGLAEAVVLLPTRRAARSLAEAFLEAAPGKALLLPQIRALGDLDEDEAPFEPGDLALDLPPAIGSRRRRFELAGLVIEHQDQVGRVFTAGVALEMADSLGRFLDSCQIEEAGEPGLLDTLVEGELARHWQISAAFLNLAVEAWPRGGAAV